MKNILILLACVSLKSVSQEAVLPSTDMSPFSSPNDCRILQYNAAVIGKKVVEIYKQVEPQIITEGTKSNVQKQLENAGHLSHVAHMLSNQHLAFCKRPSNTMR
jgi:hypothetical protein